MKFIRQRPALYLSLVVVLAGSTILLLLRKGELEQRFPDLPKGTYTGFVDGTFADTEIATPLYVEAQQDRLVVSILKTNWLPVQIERTRNQKETPVEIYGSDARLRFSGIKVDDQNFKGVVYNLDLGTKGSWVLEPFTEASAESDFTEAESAEIKQVVLLRRELRNVEQEKLEAVTNLEKQTEAVKKLEEFISNKETLRQRTADRLKKAQAEYDLADKEFRSYRREARALAQQLALSERVTEAGNLVSLSRKSIDRENRWLDSMFGTAGAIASYDFDSDVKRAQRIIELKTEIARLRGEGESVPSIDYEAN